MSIWESVVHSVAQQRASSECYLVVTGQYYIRLCRGIDQHFAALCLKACLQIRIWLSLEFEEYLVMDTGKEFPENLYVLVVPFWGKHPLKYRVWTCTNFILMI